MSLLDKLEEAWHLDSSTSVLLFDDGCAIGCEQRDSDTVFALLCDHAVIDGRRFASHFPHHFYPSRLVSTGAPADFSPAVMQLLDDYAKNLPDPLAPIASGLKDAYNKILEPVRIEPVRKRDLGIDLPIIGFTLTYPLSFPAVYLFSRAVGIRDIDGTSIALGLLSIPGHFKDALDDLVSPSVKGVRIANKDIFSKYPMDGDYVGITNPGRGFPDFFGDASSLTEPKAYLQLTFSDGLQLHNGFAFYPADGNHYSSAKYFLKVDRALTENVYSLKRAEEELVQRRGDFVTTLDPKEIGAVLRTLEGR